MRITPINDAEAIIEPFWDPVLSELNQWTIESGPVHGLKVSQNWCWVEFEWARRPAAGPALRMRRTCGIACGDYDRLVLSVMAPEKAVVRIIAETDRGLRRLDAPPAGIKKKELALDLQGATRLEAVTIEVEAVADGITQGWFNWLGLQHSGRLAHKLKSQTTWDARWEKYLKEETFEPRFTPAYGLVLNADELAALHARHAQLVATGSASPFAAAAEVARVTPPEAMIQDFVNLWDDSRYNRERDHGKNILWYGLSAAVAGHLLQDKSLLRLAARYALSIGMCTHWDDGFICHFPGGTFEHRCFVKSLCAYEVAGILDLAGECFTDLGRNFLLRRLAEEAIGAISYNTWKHDYIFHCNQLNWFSPGRILALGVLYRHWPRVRPQLDIAYRELCESLERTILPDGGYREDGYFGCIGRDVALGVYYYSRSLGKPMVELIPPAMKCCGDFGDAMASTADGFDVVTMGDGRGLMEIISMANMATLLPQSAWHQMLCKALARHAGWPIHRTSDGEISGTRPMMHDAAIAWNLINQLPQHTDTNRPPLVRLPDMGPLVSHRKLGEHWVKLFIQGNKAGAGHTHEDKGSFVLEFAGETFAMDPGSCDYSSPLAGALTNCERHNMLVPIGTTERPHPTCPTPVDVKPHGEGNAIAFQAEIDLSPGWEAYYRTWVRSWESPKPEYLIIRDRWALRHGTGVACYWQTRLSVQLNGQVVTITGRCGQVVITAPENCTISVKELPLMNDEVQRRITFAYNTIEGEAVLRVNLIPLST